MSQIIAIFVPANSRHADFSANGETEWQQEGALHIEKCLLTLWLCPFEPEKFKPVNKDIAEVGTAGRYMKHRPVGVQRIVHPQARSTDVIYTNGAGVRFCLFFTEVFSGPKRRASRGQMPRFSYVVNKFINSLYLGI